MAHQKKSGQSSPQEDWSQPAFRSGAVARMAGMPVSTLRIWEQRYQAVGPSTAPSGHRLYSAADVERVTLLRRLTENGHAIGLLAGLDTEQMRKLFLPQSTAEAQASVQLLRHKSPMKMVVVGQAMAQRLNRPSFQKRWASPPQLLGVFDSLAEAIQAGTGSPDAAVDLLLWQAAGLQVGALTELKAAQAAWSARGVAVVYRFSSAAARDELTGGGAAVVRELADDAALGHWLASLESSLSVGTGVEIHPGGSTDIEPGSFGAMGLIDMPLPARRFDDAALTKFAGLSSGIACECPGHVAELLMQISNFESYSAGCISRSPADALLHAYLQRVAGTARILFETALQRVAVEEGWPLP